MLLVISGKKDRSLSRRFVINYKLFSKRSENNTAIKKNLKVQNGNYIPSIAKKPY